MPILPLFTAQNLIRSLSSVDLPQPLSPTIPMIWFSWILREKFLSTGVLP